MRSSREVQQKPQYESNVCCHPHLSGDVQCKPLGVVVGNPVGDTPSGTVAVAVDKDGGVAVPTGGSVVTAQKSIILYTG